MLLNFTGLRKKRAAPPPPVTRPLSSAISTQGLERIVDSEESLTSDIDPSKPPSDIGVPSKANSDIEERPKASSDIGVTTVASKLSGSIDFTKSEIAKTELESKNSKSKVDPCSRLGSTNVKLSGTEPEHPAPVEDAPVDSRVLRKRGKLVHSRGSMENNVPSYSFVSTNNFENVEEGTDFVRRRINIFDPEKGKLQPKIQGCSAEYRNNKISDELSTSFSKSRSVTPKIKSLESKSNSFGLQHKLQRSQSLADSNVVISKSKQWNKMSSLSGNEATSSRNSFKSQNRLIKMQTLINLDDIETDIENMPVCGVLENRFSPRKLHVDNYICEGKCQAKPLKHSSSFQAGYKLRETKIINSFEKPKLLSSRSFCAHKNVPVSTESKQPRLGNVDTTKYYNGLISSSLDRNTFEGSMINNHRSNLSPPPLSNLQIFAISTKPLDIPVTAIEPIPSNVDKLPSLPIIQHSECRLESEKKLSILEPPPPGLVSREESTESWNRFLIQLNSILESRIGEFV